MTTEKTDAEKRIAKQLKDSKKEETMRVAALPDVPLSEAPGPPSIALTMNPDARPNPEQPKLEYGIKELKEVTTMVAMLGKGVADAMADGKWNFTDGMFFVDFLKAVPAAVSGIADVDDEIADLTMREIDEVIEHIAGKLGNVAITAALKDWVVNCIRTAMSIIYLVQTAPKAFKK